MDRFRNILAVYGDEAGSDDVLVQAVSIARRTDARLTIVGCSTQPRPDRLVAEARRRMTRIAPWIVQEGVRDVTTDILVGTPHTEIIRTVLRGGHDLVIASAESSQVLRDALFGSTALHLLRKCPCAVWLLKPGLPVPCTNIAAAVDLDHGESDNALLDEKILDLATTLARTQNACLHAMHFWDVDGAEKDMLHSEIRDTTKRDIIEKHEGARRLSLDALLARRTFPQTETKIHLHRGTPERHLAALANRLSVDLLIMGAASRFGVSRLLTGNFSEAVLQSVRCSVLAVKPDGFRTPVVPDRQEAPLRRVLAPIR
jgi:nucleotide-binding universal stress UspA family protein